MKKPKGVYPLYEEFQMFFFCGKHWQVAIHWFCVISFNFSFPKPILISLQVNFIYLVIGLMTSNHLVCLCKTELQNQSFGLSHRKVHAQWIKMVESCDFPEWNHCFWIVHEEYFQHLKDWRFNFNMPLLLRWDWKTHSLNPIFTFLFQLESQTQSRIVYSELSRIRKTTFLWTQITQLPIAQIKLLRWVLNSS